MKPITVIFDTTKPTGRVGQLREFADLYGERTHAQNCLATLRARVRQARLMARLEIESLVDAGAR